MARGRRNYKPAAPFNVAMRLLTPTTTIVKGVKKPTYPNPETSPDECPLFYGSFRTFGGTESNVNEVYTVVDTATIDTWYRPDIKADCRIYLCDAGMIYEIMATPENIEMRNQYLQIRCRRLGGGG